MRPRSYAIFPYGDGDGTRPSAKPVAICPYCDGPIYAGDEVREIDGNRYHEECLHDMPTSELLDLLGIEVEVA